MFRRAGYGSLACSLICITPLVPFPLRYLIYGRDPDIKRRRRDFSASIICQEELCCDWPGSGRLKVQLRAGSTSIVLGLYLRPRIIELAILHSSIATTQQLKPCVSLGSALWRLRWNTFMATLTRHLSSCSRHQSTDEP
jgi:hypothetical protein